MPPVYMPDSIVVLPPTDPQYCPCAAGAAIPSPPRSSRAPSKRRTNCLPRSAGIPAVAGGAEAPRIATDTEANAAEADRKPTSRVWSARTAGVRRCRAESRPRRVRIVARTREGIVIVGGRAADGVRTRTTIPTESTIERCAVVGIVAAVALQRVIRVVLVRQIAVDRRPEHATVEPVARPEAAVLCRSTWHGQQSQAPQKQERAQYSPHSSHLAFAVVRRFPAGLLRPHQHRGLVAVTYGTGQATQRRCHR